MRKSWQLTLQWLIGLGIIFLLTFQSKPYLSPYFKNQGLQLAKKGYLNEAVFFLNVARFFNPEDFLVHFKLGEIYYYKKLYQLAEGQLTWSLKINPHYTSSYILLGKLYHRLEEDKKALSSLQKALQLEPYNREIFTEIERIKQSYIEKKINQAASYLNRNNIPKTKASLKEALQMSKGTFFNLFVLENQPPKEIADEQITKLEALSHVSDHPDKIYRLLATRFMQKHNFAKAIEYYKRCLSHNPTDVTLLNNLAIAYFEKGDYPSAIKQYRIALSYQPGNYLIIYGLARCYERTDSSSEAKKLYEFLLPLEKEIPFVHLRLAEIATQRKDFKKAKQDLQRAIELAQNRLKQHAGDTVALITIQKSKEKFAGLVTNRP